MKQSYISGIAETLIKQCQQGTAPWVKPWSPGERFMPFNPVTGKDYRGMNAIVLLMTAQALGYGDPRWMTYRQASAEGAQVRRGETSTTIQYWKWREERPLRGPDGKPLRDSEGKPLIEVIDLVRPQIFTAAVFNGAQIDGLATMPARPALPEWQRHELAEAILNRSGADIRHLPGDHAFYHRIGDYIVLPERSQFASADRYYSTALHELGHWTGHIDRLNRDLAHPFGSIGYAREELRAEIASLMLGDRLAIGYDPAQHVSYIGHFLDILLNQPQEIFRAAADAEKIVTYLRAFVQTENLDQQTTMREKTTVLPARIEGQGDAVAQARVDLVVPFAEKDAAKALGAKWDRRTRCWYVPAGTDPEPFLRWRQTVATRSIADDPRVEFAAALSAAGLLIKGLPVMDGSLRRVPVQGDHKGQRSGAYIGHLNGHPAGFYENFKTAIRANWKSEAPRQVLTAVDRAKLLAEAAEKQRQREDERKAIAAETAGRIAEHLGRVPLLEAAGTTANHAYLTRKGVGSHGVYLNTAGSLALLGGEAEPQLWSAKGELIVPIRDIDGVLLGAQSIAADGRKSFPRGALLLGGHHLIGAVEPGGRLLIAEGYATAATLYEAMALPVAVAFMAGNLEAVARAYRDRDPELRIVIAGDNDHRRERERGPDAQLGSNVGKAKAEAAARAVGGTTLVPPFTAAQHGSDWNDLARHCKPGELQSVLSLALAAAKSSLANTPDTSALTMNRPYRARRAGSSR